MASVERVLIVGAGLGGLAESIALAQHDIKADIIEVRPHSDVLGVGINQPGNALRSLDELGVLDEVRKVGYEFDRYRFHDYKGNLFAEVQSVIGGDGIPQSIAMTRRDLHNILIAEGKKLGVKVRYDTTLTSLDDQGDHVDVTFSDGTTDTYDLVIGFDGIHSELRKQLFGPQFDPAYTGYGVWRMKFPRLEGVRASTMYHGINAKAGCVPLNEEEMYLLLVTPEPEDVWIEKEDMADELRKRLASFEGFVGDVRDNIQDDDEIAYGPLTEVRLPKPWYKGRVIVLGDAAHAAVPHLAQGAGMAIEDAIVLAEELDQDRPLQTALEAFMERRYPRVKFVQDVSRAVLMGEMAPVDEATLAESVEDLRAHLKERMNGSDNFLKQPA